MAKEAKTGRFDQLPRLTEGIASPHFQLGIGFRVLRVVHVYTAVWVCYSHVSFINFVFDKSREPPRRPLAECPDQKFLDLRIGFTTYLWFSVITILLENLIISDFPHSMPTCSRDVSLK